MKFTSAVSCLIVATAAFAVVSTEATSIRGKSMLLNDPSMEAAEPAARNNNLSRRLEEDNENDNDADQNEGEDEENNAENDQAEEGQDEEQDNADQNEEAEAEKEGDDYVFYDDEALQNCEEGDEDCELAAQYAAYDDEYLANCEDDDEDCNNAAAYMAAKQNKEDEPNINNEWNVNNITDKYNSMSRTSKIWITILAVWFSILVITTCYFCCCRTGTSREMQSRGKSGKSKKSLRQSLIGGNSRRESEGVETAEELKRGRSKFRLFKSKRSTSKGPV